MVRAWYVNVDEVAIDQRNPCMTENTVTLEELKRIGVEYFEVDADSHETSEAYSELKKKRGYSFEDKNILNPETMPNYDQMIKSLFQEHIHKGEETRFILDGTGYFDVRDANDKWIRIEVTKNDLLVLPSGIYHRFTLAKNDYIEVIRLFPGNPVWTAFNRPADDFAERKNYVSKFAVKCA